jgi:hypothetical protein
MAETMTAPVNLRGLKKFDKVDDFGDDARFRDILYASDQVAEAKGV